MKLTVKTLKNLDSLRPTTRDIVTHDGVFHADEITAISLMVAFGGKWKRVIRTRDQKFLENAINTAGVVLVDVGGEYNPANFIFDHHHSKDGIEGKASAGIIAEWLGITPEEYPSLSQLIREVDAQDIGVALNPPHHFSNIIKSFNARTPFGQDNSEAFSQALEFAISYIVNLKLADEADFKIRQELEKAKIIEVNGAKVILRGKGDTFIQPAKAAGKADLMISWDANQDAWTVSTIPIQEGSFGSKYLIKGVSNASFVHPAGFIAKSKSSKELAIELEEAGKKREVVVQLS